MKVRTFNLKELNKKIKKSDPVIQKYIEKLKDISNNHKRIAKKTIAKLRQLTSIRISL